MAVLGALKLFHDYDVSVIVNMTDDGGSNLVVRDVFGLLPLSDLRKSIIALSRTPDDILRKIFTYRFCKGDGLSGHTLGNLIMTGLSDIMGSEIKAIEAACQLFHVRGQVIPVTLDHVDLMATYDDGKVVKGEHIIDEPIDISTRHIIELSLAPHAKAYEAALEAIRTADAIIFGPGDLYTTTLAAVVVDGVKEAIAASRAQCIFISNLMTKRGQTHGMTSNDLVRELTRYIGRHPDVVVVHNKPLPSAALEHYASMGEQPIPNTLKNDAPFQIVLADIVHDAVVERQAGDTLERSLIRHDSLKLATVLRGIISDASILAVSAMTDTVT